MSVEEKQILVGLLSKGMFVSRLDRDWVGTPFPFQGFYIESDEEIETLALYCTSVYVDVVKSPAARAPALRSAGGASVFPPRGPEYVNSVAVADELPRARQVHADVHSLAAQLADDVRVGGSLSPGKVRDAMEAMVESLLRNVDAMFWLIGVMKRDQYAYSHAVNCSALATAYGRHLALPRDTLLEMATGGFLLDIGKAALGEELFNHDRPLGPDARLRMRGHVAEGLRLIEDAGIRGRWTVDMLAAHHERHDGSGYPNGLAGSDIPLAGRIGGVVDTYDALCSQQRPHAKGVNRHEALQTIYRASGTLYQSEVVEQFLQCLGVYPTGSLVELSTGQVGIVMAQNQARRLRPRVMLLLTAEKVPYEPYRDIDLMAMEQDEDARDVKIVATLDPGAYGLDPAELYLL